MRIARIVVVMGAAAGAASAFAVNKSWNAGSGDWNVGANWSPPGVPQPGDIVDIDVDAAATVTVTVTSSVPAIASLSCAEALTIAPTGQLQVDGASTFAASATLTANGTFNAVGGVDAGTFVVSSGSLTLGADSFANMATVFGAAASLVMAPATSLVVEGTLVWSGGTIGDATTSTDGSIRVAETGSLIMTLNTTRFLNTTLEVDGAGTWSAMGNLFFHDGVLQIDTVPPDVFNVGGPGVILASNNGGTNVLRVNGTLTRAGTSSVTIGNGVQLQNNGLVDLHLGSIGFQGGGSSSGDFIGVAGTKLTLGGNHTFTGSSDIVGDLDIQFSSGTTTYPNAIVTAGTVTAAGGTVTIAGGVDAGAIVVSSGSLTCGADSFADTATVSGGFLAATSDKSLVVAGTLTWSGGAIGNGTTSTDGSIRVAKTGSLNMTASNTRFLYTTLEVDGAGTWSGAGMAFFADGVLQIDTAAPDVFNIGGSGAISVNANGGTNVLRVNGAATKVGAGTVTLNIVQLENNGLLDVHLGEFDAAGSSSNLAGTTLTGGQWRVKGTLRLPTTALATIAADVTLDGPTAQILESFTGANLLAGLTTISPIGALRLESDRTQAVPLPLAVDGTLDIDQTSVLAAAANLTFGPTGTYSIDFGSDGMAGFVNGKSTVGGAATLDGLVRAVQIGGYVPAPCDAFVIMTAGSIGGMFAAQDLPPVSTFPIWSVATAPTTVTLLFADSDLNDDLLVDGADLGIMLSQWGGAGSGDLDCDGLVNGGDLGILLSSWGASP
ncbi:MAG: hypothetical protein U0575_06900 [Phycisphaerales bacterium]